MQINFISSSQINEYLNRGARFIDLRDREEYEKRHIKHAISMPYEQFEGQYQALARNRTYVLYCERGATSMLAARKMLKEGYDVLSLSGGIMGVTKKD